MAVKTGQSVTISFCVKNSDGTPTDADSTPAAKLRKNGTDQGTSVTVAKVAGASGGDGQYLASWTQPTTAAADNWELLADFAVSGTGYGWQPLWRDVGDTKFVGDLQDVSMATMSATLATASGLATALASLQAHGDSAWATATGFVLAGAAPSWYTAPDNSDVASLVTSVGASLGSHVGSILTLVSSSGVVVATNNDKTGYALAAAGLDSIDDSEPSGATAGWSWRQRLTWLAGRFLNKATAPDSGNGTLTLYQRDGTTTMSTQTVSDDGSTQTQGGA